MIEKSGDLSRRKLSVRDESPDTAISTCHVEPTSTRNARRTHRRYVVPNSERLDMFGQHRSNCHSCGKPTCPGKAYEYALESSGTNLWSLPRGIEPEPARHQIGSLEQHITSIVYRPSEPGRDRRGNAQRPVFESTTRPTDGLPPISPFPRTSQPSARAVAVADS